MTLADAGAALGGLGFLLLALLALVAGVVWLIFPFIVANGLGRLEKLLSKQNALLEKLLADRGGNRPSPPE